MQKLHKANKMNGPSGIRVPDNLEMRETEQVVTAEQESSLRERALLVRFSIGRWYGRGTDEVVVNEVREAKNATGEIGVFQKRLMKRQRLYAINSVTNASRKYHKMMTLPWAESTRLLSVEAFRDYMARMRKYEDEFNKAVDVFMAEYPKFVQDEKKNLGDLWTASDYPSVEEMRERFRFGLQIDPIPDASDIRVKLSADQAREIREEIERRIHASLVAAVVDVYDRIAAEISEAKGKFDNPDAQLRKSVLQPIETVLDLLPKLNVARDPKLTQLGKTLKAQLSTIDVDAAKQSSKERKSASAKADAMLKSIASLRSGGGGDD